MAHFLTIVLVDPVEADPAARAEQMMTHFWALESFDDETGERLPNVKCDGFVVGGRFDGLIWGKEQHYNLKPHEFQERYGLDVVRPEDNTRPVRQLVPDLLPYAIITPDGQWHDGDDLSNAGWRAAAHRLLAEHGDRIAVAIDCHV